MEALTCDEDDYYTSLLLMEDSQIFEKKNTFFSDNDGDEDFAQKLQLQETLISSFTTSSQKPQRNTSSIEVGESSSSSKKRRRLKEEKESSSPSKKRRRSKEEGESPRRSSSTSSRFVCEICTEKKKKYKIFPFLNHNCSHKFCTECISKYLTTKLKRGKSPSIACPGPDCEGILGIEECVGGVVPKEVVTLWDEVICESVIIPSSQRFYCPYKNCSALMMNDSDTRNTMREAECPSCRRLFCVKCNVPWHSGFECGDFSRMRESESEREDLKLHALAKKKKWRRCRRCKFFVERNKGCLHMTCRLVNFVLYYIQNCYTVHFYYCDNLGL
ncbi:hypothetical protein MIMGU_mgv1a022384mg [Erythranthe guttata]|uniref:RBR-type E3 ubiquitin transferase n=1 Tax=Erythranthe guttata TaxID=4155 RepID=A0A022QAD1_ERYGU|nr:hypothetical protein MIMGU_mgv1a022384mg [Erythranthe guttata]